MKTDESGIQPSRKASWHEVLVYPAWQIICQGYVFEFD